jgi:hypothetical protein
MEFCNIIKEIHKEVQLCHLEEYYEAMSKGKFNFPYLETTYWEETKFPFHIGSKRDFQQG